MKSSTKFYIFSLTIGIILIALLGSFIVYISDEFKARAEAKEICFENQLSHIYLTEPIEGHSCYEFIDGGMKIYAVESLKITKEKEVENNG